MRVRGITFRSGFAEQVFSVGKDGFARYSLTNEAVPLHSKLRWYHDFKSSSALRQRTLLFFAENQKREN